MEDNSQCPKASLSSGYIAIVGLLLAGIIVMLAVLWFRERSARINLQNAVIETESRNENVRNMLMSLPGLVPGAGEEAPPAPPVMLDRNSLQPVTLDVQGRPREVFNISTAAGLNIGGFKPGDVIVVGPIDAQ
ncbi:MAG: hypothetical protein GXY38_00085 [Planctomycetes bacterium]|jgi:hypothetical protein|nr:hypothetical protein [Planctomycetota bacterium]